MTKLVWGQTTDRRYETGTDRGVLYPSSGPGVAWNGLISVEESAEGADLQSYYFDGVKYLDTVDTPIFKATITAFSAPVEFGPCVGEASVKPGFILTGQPKSRFGFSYRTMIGTSAYKIHLVYNATVKSPSRGYAAINDSPSPTSLAWEIDAVPVASTTYRPSAHFIVDSRKAKAAALATLEGQLYGTKTAAPFLPTPSALITLLK